MCTRYILCGVKARVKLGFLSRLHGKQIFISLFVRARSPRAAPRIPLYSAKKWSVRALRCAIRDEGARGDDDRLPLSVADIARSKGRLHLTIRFGFTPTAIGTARITKVYQSQRRIFFVIRWLEGGVYLGLYSENKMAVILIWYKPLIVV